MDFLLFIAVVGILQYIGLQFYIGLKISQNETGFSITSSLGGFNTSVAIYGASGSIAFISFAYILYKIFMYRRR